MNKHKHRLVTLSVITTMSSISIAIINKLINSSATMKDLLYVSSENNFYNWRFGNVYYTKEGSGSPILCIHDLTPYSSGYEWNQMVETLSKTHTVYTLDLLGCGRSDKPKITYTNFLYTQLISDFIRNIIHEKTDIIATGLSTSFAITACNNEPSLFGKLMLISPKDFANLNQIPSPRSKVGKFVLELPLIGTLVFNMLNTKENIGLEFTEKLFYNPFHIIPRDISLCYEAAHRGNGNGKYLLASIVGNFVNFNILHALKNINNSIYIIGGEKSNNIHAVIKSYINYNPAIEYSFIPRTADAPHIENAKEVLEQADIFFC